MHRSSEGADSSGPRRSLSRMKNTGRYSIAWPIRATGLGNRLFPWACCEIMSRDLSLSVLAPQMATIRRGALFRGGIDYQHFITKTLLWDNFDFKNYVRGVKRLSVLLSYPRIPEDRVRDDVSAAGRAMPADGLVVFRGYGDLFVSLRGEHAFLLEKLRGMTKAKWIEEAEKPRYALGVNIRLGRDFSVPSSEQDMQRQGLMLTPIEWFVKAIKEVQKRVGQVPCLVVSDGNREALRPILELPNVRLFGGRSAVSDLLCLARCSALIGTGGSSFTAWAAYLANAPVLTHASRSQKWFRLDEAVPFVGVYPGSDIDRFSELLTERILTSRVGGTTNTPQSSSLDPEETAPQTS